MPTSSAQAFAIWFSEAFPTHESRMQEPAYIAKLAWEAGRQWEAPTEHPAGLTTVSASNDPSNRTNIEALHNIIKGQPIPKFDDSAVGGAFDGFAVSSDADEGL